MAEDPKSEKIELTEVMLAMDVVDTLRHRQSLIERELRSEERDSAFIEKLRKVYADQGLEVSDEIIAAGVAAMREDRFTYHPPRGGFKIALARLYVNRGRWLKRGVFVVAALFCLWLLYEFAFVLPAERKRAELARELNTEIAAQADRLKIQKETLRNLQLALASEQKEIPEIISLPVQRLTARAQEVLSSSEVHLKALDGLASSPDLDKKSVLIRAGSERNRLGERKELLDLVQKDLEGASAAVQNIKALKLEAIQLQTAWNRFQKSSPTDSITKAGQYVFRASRQNLQDGKLGAIGSNVASLEALLALPDKLQTLRANTLDEVREKGVSNRVETLFQDGMKALEAGNIEEAQKAYRSLRNLQNQLRQEYTLQIVSRQGVSSGVWRYPANNRSTRNYYIIVEAVTPNGHRLTLPVTAEEDGQTHLVDHWGLRVSQRVYEMVKQDKMDDGIVNRNRFGIKRRGYLTPEYFVSTTGGAITEW